LSKIRAFLCFQIFQVAVAKTSKKERLSKVGTSSGHQLREIKVVFEGDVY